jgi:putative membrane protein
MRYRWVLAGSAALLTVSMVSSAQVRSYPVAQLTMDFVRRAAQDGMAEVALARMARVRSADPAVRRFADQMWADHARANTELRRIAARRGWRMPATMTGGDQAELRRLSRLSGAPFDRAYMRIMLRDHERALELFRQYASRGRDEELRAWAESKLSGLEHHRAMASETAERVGVRYSYAR